MRTHRRKGIHHADEKTVINVDLNMFGQDADAKTAAANEVAKSLGISDEASLRWRNSRQPHRA